MTALSISGCAYYAKQKSLNDSKPLFTIDPCKSHRSINSIVHIDGKALIVYDESLDKECNSK